MKNKNVITEDVKIFSLDDGRSISRNIASLNILVHNMINLLYYYNNRRLQINKFQNSAYS